MNRHMIVNVTAILVLATVFPLRMAADQPEAQRPAEARRAAREAARHNRQNVEKLIARLDNDQRDLAAHPHDESAIRQISLFPGRRGGVRIGDLNEQQRTAVERLLAGVFAEDAHRRIQEVFKQDSGQGDYYFARFWDGRPSDPLTWRIEGHHFSATFVIDGKDRIRPGTLLIGGRNNVWKPLDQKVRDLFASLGDEQQKKAMRAQPPRRTGHPPFKGADSGTGLSWEDLTPAQKEKVRALMGAFESMFQEGVLHAAQQAFERDGGPTTLQIVFSGNPGDPEGEYHCGLRGGAARQIEFDTRDAHVHMLLHFGEVGPREERSRTATSPAE